MFRLTDLKRLKKDELLKLAVENSINISGKENKADVIKQLIANNLNHTQSIDDATATPTSIADLLPEDVSVDNLYFSSVTDKSVNLLPNCSFASIYKHCCRGDEASSKALDRAVQHSAAGDVHNICQCQVDMRTYVRAKCHASQKKTAYTSYVAINDDGAVLASQCQCPIGVRGRCSHVGAVLFTLSDIKRTNCADISKTSALCRWTEPTQKATKPRPINDITFSQSNAVNDTDKKRQKLSFDPRRSTDRNTLSHSELSSAVQSLTAICPNSCLAFMWGVSSEAHKVTDSSDYNTPEERMKCLILTPGSLDLLRLHQTIDNELVQLVEKSTEDQVNSELWCKLHVGRITSSIFGQVYKSKVATSLVESILYPRKFHTEATEYGKRHEADARKQYEASNGVKVHPTGLTLMSSHHYIGASADGIVDSTVIEIKCPFTGRDKTVLQLVRDGYKHIKQYDDGVLALSSNSPYYCQIQGEMAIKGCNMCHLVVWTPQDMQVFAVPFDAQFWNDQLLPKLVAFFEQHIKPKLVAEE